MIENERDIEKYFCKRVKMSGGWAIKFVSPGIAGVPDRIVLYPEGKIYFVELKRPGQKMRVLQKKIAKMLSAFGFNVFLIDRKMAVDDFIWEVTCNE